METRHAKWACLRAWNWMYNVSQSYIQTQIDKAEHEEAPPNAIYKAGDRWLTVDDITDARLKREVLGMAQILVLAVEQETRNQ